MKLLISILFIVGSILSSYTQDKQMEDQYTKLNDFDPNTAYTGKDIEKGRVRLEDGSTKDIIVEETPFVEGFVHGSYKEYYKNGKLRREIPFKKGLADSTCRFFYDNGVLNEQVNARNGIILKITDLNEDGEIISEEDYPTARIIYFPDSYEKIPIKDSTVNGFARNYYKNGKVKLEVEFQDGTVNGKYRSFYENGQVCENIDFRSGILHGWYILLNEDGEILEKTKYSDGIEQESDDYEVIDNEIIEEVVVYE